MDYQHCKKKGHRESKCWEKPKNKDSEIEGFTIDGETAFMSVSDSIPMETVQEEEVKYNQEITKEDKDKDKNSGKSSEVEPSIDWDSGTLEDLPR